MGRNWTVWHRAERKGSFLSEVLAEIIDPARGHRTWRPRDFSRAGLTGSHCYLLHSGDSQRLHPTQFTTPPKLCASAFAYEWPVLSPPKTCPSAAGSESPRASNSRSKAWQQQPALLHSWALSGHLQMPYKEEESADVSVAPAEWPKTVVDLAPPWRSKSQGTQWSV
uniref:Uncharacterized protein n=1 Tax=Pipistrellus kuhlii TaxID=59472 RepID=A0A7J7W3Q8_PIPKU|nr:hypothetical protein mPipKuh1_008199 [Pipistrellus kuhlii]